MPETELMASASRGEAMATVPHLRAGTTFGTGLVFGIALLSSFKSLVAGEYWACAFGMIVTFVTLVVGVLHMDSVNKQLATYRELQSKLRNDETAAGTQRTP